MRGIRKVRGVRVVFFYQILKFGRQDLGADVQDGRNAGSETAFPVRAEGQDADWCQVMPEGNIIAVFEFRFFFEERRSCRKLVHPIGAMELTRDKERGRVKGSVFILVAGYPAVTVHPMAVAGCSSAVHQEKICRGKVDYIRQFGDRCFKETGQVADHRNGDQ